MAQDTYDMSDEALDAVLESTVTDDSPEGFSTVGSESGNNETVDVSPSDDIVVEQIEEEEAETDVGQTEEPSTDLNDSLSTEESNTESEVEETVVDNETTNGNSETSTESETESGEEPYALQPLKADGKEYPIESMQELYTLASKGIAADKKWQESAEGRKIAATLKNNNLTPEDINMLVELKKGDKNAIASLLRSAEIDPLDIDVDALDGSYNPKDHSVGDFEMQLEDVISRVKTQPRYDEATNVIMDRWDEQSKSEFYKNPKILELLNLDMQVNPELGYAMYDKVAPYAEKMKALDTGVKRSDIEYYRMAGAKVIETLKKDNQLKTESKEKKKTQKTEAKNVIDKKKKSAAASGGTTVPKQVKDVTTMSDEELDRFIEETS